jgi:hypothetical protein
VPIVPTVPSKVLRPLSAPPSKAVLPTIGLTIADEGHIELFEFICEPPQKGRFKILSVVLIFKMLHNISAPPDCSQFALRLVIAGCRCNVFTVPLQQKSRKKGTFQPTENKKLLAHFNIRQEVLVKIDFVGNERVLASTNLLLLDPRLTTSGKYLLSLSQRPQRSCFIKNENEDLSQRGPCLEIQLKSVSVALERKLRRLPHNIILPVVAVDAVVAFREVLQDFRSSRSGQPKMQLLSLFRGILEKAKSLKKLAGLLTESMKKIPRDRQIIEQNQVFIKSLIRIAVRECGVCSPFHTSEVGALYAAGDLFDDPFEISRALF